MGVGGDVKWGGTQLGNAISSVAKAFQMVSTQYANEAVQAGKMAVYVRRQQEWTLQAILAAREIIQIDKQITVAEIRIQIANKELENHNKQIDNSKEVEDFLKNKFTNQELYQWMRDQIFAVYKQSYNMAYDMAKKAEKAYRYDLGKEISNFIQFVYWDNIYQGLTSGEKLALALKQMEKSFIEENKRELELKKNISLIALNPLALLELREAGTCCVNLPEELFDLDFQGHYFRRIKSVSISIPCISGPHTTINCSLRLLKNTIRINTSKSDSAGNYEHNHDEGFWTDDDRFRENIVLAKSIATSSAQNDAGMFELNFRDERYLPFEGAGVISDWQIELTKEKSLRQFDYSTIADVIMHISYTAREDAGTFKDDAVDYLKDKFLKNIEDLKSQPLVAMFSMKHEFSTEWNKFLHPQFQIRSRN